MQIARSVAVQNLQDEARLFVGEEALDVVLCEVAHDVAVLQANRNQVVFGCEDTQRDGRIDEILALHFNGGDVHQDQAGVVLSINTGALFRIQRRFKHIEIRAGLLRDALDLFLIRMHHGDPAALFRTVDLDELIVDCVEEGHHCASPP